MKVILEKVAYEQKSILRQLLELYKYDFSEYELDDVNEQGLYDYKYLDYYWTEDGRHAFFIRVDEKLAGFALVRALGVNAEGEDIHSMAEFFVMKKYRRRGVGNKAAIRLFDLLPGNWKVGQVENNAPSQLFWRKIIAEYTGHSYVEGRRDDCDGPLQTFKSNHLKQRE
ncbi:Predicted acetyltransferase [Paenibacillus sp. 1_12]|uniref:GNAT family N-acetyltransferase n=1 Tax=Paenibacillus sp. 1_12 TaxID=1566278 RepID=UPI0008E96EB5|nr:GNAT family N-acetyltransferase [Paenibacillus sp. 1_12]SFM14287.1 Predicted acetyltransferase [Paenibacillus sp. 1_12]